jgi:D-alanyl-lipoteichoic acid acyltransferase DltB (MBOAT superfamily)
VIFNSINFALFLPIVFILYWHLTNSLKGQNRLLLIASYFFYDCWDWRFLFLLMYSTLLDYYTGLKISSSKRKEIRKFWLWLSIIVNLGFLGFFKYYNFFAESFSTSATLLGWHVSPWVLQVVLPIGISFYTFHGLSYVIDVYRERIYAERNFVEYAVFVSFFPLLVAGPIERATHLLPQVKKTRVFNYSQAVDGLRQILWGLFKKMVIADNCAQYANMVFDNPDEYSASTLALGAVFFAFQIYGDFSGYSDIALGTARLFGIELLKNFAFPYFSRDIAEFWRRWHISLSSWFRDYLYIPLGGSKGGTWMKVRNTFIIFIVSGFWHGANWTFLVWGLLNAIYYLPLLLTNTNRSNLDVAGQDRFLPSLKELFQIMLTFSLTVIAWIFFRAENLTHAVLFLSHMFSSSLLVFPEIFPKVFILLLSLFIVVEWIGRSSNYAIENIGLQWNRPNRYIIYYTIVAIIILCSAKQQEFIYFQF